MRRRPQDISRDRLLYALAALGAAAVVLISRILTPTAARVGTHEQLGLPPCTFHAVTGHGCPGCGLTTAFSLLSRGDLTNAAQSNPVGVLMFAVVVLSIPYFLYNIVRPTPIDQLLGSRWPVVILISFALLMFVVWAVRLSLGQI